MRALRWLAGLALVAYPVLVWLGLTAVEDVSGTDGDSGRAEPGWASPRWLALMLLLLVLPVAVVRLRSSRRAAVRGLAFVPLVAVVGLLAAAILDGAGLMLAVPAAINAVVLGAFGVTLRAGAMPMIERFARLQEPELDAEQRAWCRLWTWIWCAFFLVNGTVAAMLALFAPLSWWAFYNGLLSYGLVGLLLGGEWLLRRRRFPPSTTSGKVPSTPASEGGRA
ncbi:MAG: hypothetical protein NXI31_16195 [bacterium]|nr:hypothetical protein [bacterium]